jgi:Ras-related protein Rab-18
MEQWYEEAETNAMPGAVMYLVGSKLDKSSSRAVMYEEGEALAARHESLFCEVSSKTRENVRKPFIEIVDQIVNNPQLLNASSRNGGGMITVGGSGEAGSSCAC